MSVTVDATPPAVRVTLQLLPTATGPPRLKLRDTDRAATGATPSLVLKSTPTRLTTTRSLPSANARKFDDAAALIAAARPAAISERVGRRKVGVAGSPSASIRATSWLKFATRFAAVTSPTVQLSPAAMGPDSVVRVPDGTVATA